MTSDVVTNYRLYGLTVSSTVALPNVQSLPAHTSQVADVRIVEAPLPAGVQQPTGAGIFYELNACQCLLDLSNIIGTRYWVQNGNEIRIERQPGVSDDEIRVFLFGSALAALLYQRHLLPLHGSAICTRQGVVLFVGESGSGKSTLAAAFQQRGYQVLTDDVGVVTFDQANRPMLSPGYPQLNLWADALTLLPTPIDHALPIRPVLEKYQWSIPQPAAANDNLSPTVHPIIAIFLLQPHNGDEVRLEAIQGMSKLAALQQHIYRHRFALEMGKQAWLFQQLSLLAQPIQLFRLYRPQQRPSLHELIEHVEHAIDC